jgi:hypothetical protein
MQHPPCYTPPHPPQGRSAYAALHFTELLVGPRCAKLAVKDPARFHFDRSKLMASMAQLVAQLGARPEFAAAVRLAWFSGGAPRGTVHRISLWMTTHRIANEPSSRPPSTPPSRDATWRLQTPLTPNFPPLAPPPQMAAEPDYESSTIDAGVKLLNDTHQYALGDALTSVAARLAGLRAGAAATAAGGAAAAAGTSPSTPSKRPRQGAGAAKGGGAAPMEVDSGGGGGGGGVLEAAAGGDAGAIDALVAAWKLPGPGTYEEAEGPYQGALQEESVGTFEAGVPGAYNSHFAAIAGQPEGECSFMRDAGAGGRWFNLWGKGSKGWGARAPRPRSNTAAAIASVRGSLCRRRCRRRPRLDRSRAITHCARRPHDGGRVPSRRQPTACAAVWPPEPLYMRPRSPPQPLYVRPRSPPQPLRVRRPPCQGTPPRRCAAWAKNSGSCGAQRRCPSTRRRPSSCGRTRTGQTRWVRVGLETPSAQRGWAGWAAWGRSSVPASLEGA